MSSFTLEMFNDIIVFEMKEVVDQISKSHTFDFIINGKINKKLNPDSIHTTLKLIRIKNAYADCEFNIRENQEADLKIHANLEAETWSACFSICLQKQRMSTIPKLSFGSQKMTVSPAKRKTIHFLAKSSALRPSRHIRKWSAMAKPIRFRSRWLFRTISKAKN